MRPEAMCRGWARVICDCGAGWCCPAGCFCPAAIYDVAVCLTHMTYQHVPMHSIVGLFRVIPDYPVSYTLICAVQLARTCVAHIIPCKCYMTPRRRAIFFGGIISAAGPRDWRRALYVFVCLRASAAGREGRAAHEVWVSHARHPAAAGARHM